MMTMILSPDPRLLAECESHESEGGCKVESGSERTTAFISETCVEKSTTVHHIKLSCLRAPKHQAVALCTKYTGSIGNSAALLPSTVSQPVLEG
jgi:hypothetical protein